MEFFNSHTRLFGTALALFIGLTVIVAIMPARQNQRNNAPLPDAIPLSADEEAGKRIYISNGCVACHTQQVRNVEMDKMWGQRPGLAADYASNKRTDVWRNTATLMGTERTGPDLTDIGNRQPSSDWHLLHLFQPRAVIPQSIMPAHQWLFEVKDSLEKDDVEINVPATFRKGITGKIVATREALQLVKYLQSLKQAPLPETRPAPDFLYRKEQSNPKTGVPQLPDGNTLYANNCQSCHQANGEGLKGAFPPLKGSPVVLGDDLELYVNIIMQGYDARQEYGAMPAVGLNNQLTADEVTALINHERTSWGNKANPVLKEEVTKIIEFINKKAKQ